MASIITIKFIKTIIRNKNVLNMDIITIFLSNTCYIRMHTIELFSFYLNVIISLKIGCANLDLAPISPLLPYLL